MSGESASARESLSHHVVDADDSFAVATVGAYIVLIWRREITSRGVAAVRRAFDHQRVHRAQTKVGFITIIRQECRLIAESEVRNELAALLKANERQIGAAAIVYEGGGFVSAVVRSVITAINLASGSHFANNVCADHAEAVTWLLRNTGAQHSPQLAEALLTLAKTL